MEVAEELIFTYAARFMNVRWAGEVIYNTDYEAHDTNYRMALIKSAKELAGDNAVVQGLITKEIIGMLAPATSIPEYEQAYIDTIENETVKDLMTQDNDQVLSRDLTPSMIPEHEMFGEEEDEKENGEMETEDNGDGVAANGDNVSILGGAGTPVTNIGQTYYASQVPPLMINQINTGR